jgi:translation initiation factor IF-3
LIMNEQIKASEVLLTGLDGEDLGIVSREEALRMAKERRVSLVCISVMSSPPPCKLVPRGMAKQAVPKDKRFDKSAGPLKVKEIRLTANIENHDYDTKLAQAGKLLQSAHAVQLVVKIQGKEGQRAKELLERMLNDLRAYGTKETGIQVSGKQAAARLNPIST